VELIGYTLENVFLSCAVGGIIGFLVGYVWGRPRSLWGVGITAVLLLLFGLKPNPYNHIFNFDNVVVIYAFPTLPLAMVTILVLFGIRWVSDRRVDRERYAA
jgi:hypothetical protein